MRHIAIALLLSFGLGCLFVSLRSMPTAHAQPAQFSPPATGAPGSAGAIHDPLEAPAPAIDDIAAAKKQHWALAALALLIMAAKGVTYLAGRFAWAAWLTKDSRATIIAACLAVSCSAYNALISGGSWFAVAAAAIGSMLAVQSPGAPPKAVALAQARVVKS